MRTKHQTVDRDPFVSSLSALRARRDSYDKLIASLERERAALSLAAPRPRVTRSAPRPQAKGGRTTVRAAAHAALLAQGPLSTPDLVKVLTQGGRAGVKYRTVYNTLKKQPATFAKTNGKWALREMSAPAHAESATA